MNNNLPLSTIIEYPDYKNKIDDERYYLGLVKVIDGVFAPDSLVYMFDNIIEVYNIDLQNLPSEWAFCIVEPDLDFFEDLWPWKRALEREFVSDTNRVVFSRQKIYTLSEEEKEVIRQDHIDYWNEHEIYRKTWIYDPETNLFNPPVPRPPEDNGIKYKWWDDDVNWIPYDEFMIKFKEKYGEG